MAVHDRDAHARSEKPTQFASGGLPGIIRQDFREQPSVVRSRRLCIQCQLMVVDTLQQQDGYLDYCRRCTTTVIEAIRNQYGVLFEMPEVSPEMRKKEPEFGQKALYVFYRTFFCEDCTQPLTASDVVRLEKHCGACRPTCTEHSSAKQRRSSRALFAAIPSATMPERGFDLACIHGT